MDIERLSIPVFRRYGILRAGLFGSFARGEQQETSDLDFLVEFPMPVSLFTLGELKDELEETFGVSCDVLTYSSVERDHGSLAAIIQKEAQPLYGY
ncbi:MAG: nucleotidyltransferase family protein [Eubacteriaceae bacterium]|nr:nucleotidyltransferase family protein [Eubacteriaceae bacterium]